MTASLLTDTRTFAVIVGAAIFFSSCAFGREKTDVLVMKNGDRITCEVKKLEGGVLLVELDYADGAVSIDWLKVSRLESASLFLVYLQDGSIYSGRMITMEALPAAPVRVEIQPEPDQKAVIVDRTSIVQLTQTSESLLHRFSGSLTIGALYSKGNNATQYSFGSDVDYRQTRWGGRVRYNSNLSSNTGAPTSTRNQLDATADRLLPWKNYFFAGMAGLLQSSVQGIQRQTDLGIGVGRYLRNTNRLRFSVVGGVGWQRTNYVPEAGRQTSPDLAVALFTSNLEAFSFKKTRLDVDVNLVPALTELGRFRSSANASYYLKLFGKVDWNLSFYGNWDNQPPVALPGSDYGTSTGLSWTFGNK
jgi:putative salt-induced outer membrane protein YdiY